MCAGKTTKTQLIRKTAKDHPRVCGKNCVEVFVNRWYLGSPPRVREKLENVYGKTAQSRITPACAGKTSPETMASVIVRDHPRVCGKNYLMILLMLQHLGSPPRVREKLEVTAEGDKLIGITPACAGKTSIKLTVKTCMRDHPRVCGKNDYHRGATFTLEGSPPRVREKLSNHNAYAGD